MGWLSTSYSKAWLIFFASRAVYRVIRAQDISEIIFARWPSRASEAHCLKTIHRAGKITSGGRTSEVLAVAGN